MRKIMFVGRSGCGKTTLTQCLSGENLHYYKTHYINHFAQIIDTPGEYAETKELARALILYSFEADVVGLLISATEPYSLYSPCIVGPATRDVIGIVTQIDSPWANTEQAIRWLELTGVSHIFPVSSVTGEGIERLKSYLGRPDENYWEGDHEGEIPVDEAESENMNHDPAEECENPEA